MPCDIVLDLVKNLFANLLNGAEPLLGCPEDNLLLEAVIMRIGVGDLVDGKQDALFVHHGDDLL